MTYTAPPLTHCRRCGAPVSPGALACPNCGLFVHVEELERLAAEALRLESINPWAAASLWRQALDLLPPDSPQYQALRHRMGVLSAGMVPTELMPGAAPGPAPVLNYQPQEAPRDSLGIALAKTLGSMLVSIVVYYLFLFGDIRPAVGFCVLMLVHELGHVIANRYYGLNASPPIFIPFMGAVINLRQRPQNAKVEAVVGIAGPIAGTIGALAVYGWYLNTGNELALALSYFGFMLNLFNLLPVPPLDGGRVTAAVSPWIWMLGLAGLAWMFVDDYRRHGFVNWLLILVLFYALPRVVATLRGRDRFSDYYNISRTASWSIGLLYVALGVLLLYLFHHTGAMLHPHG
jgi:Zn-dependent protease